MKLALFLIFSLLMSPLSAAGQGIEDELTKAGYRVSEKPRNTSISKGGAYSFHIFPPRGVETTIFALGNDQGSQITLFIFDDANGNLIDKVSSAKAGVTYRFVPEGGLYRIKIKVADAPATLELIAVQRDAGLPQAFDEVVIASRD